MEHYETFLNYRRDGSPFMNLLMCTPLVDCKGKVRYFLGAQVDVSGLAKECAGLEYLKRHVEDQPEGLGGEQRLNSGARGELGEEKDAAQEAKDEFQELSEMFNLQELETVRKHGGAMHRPLQGQEQTDAPRCHKERLVIESDSDGCVSGGDGEDTTNQGSPDAITGLSPAPPRGGPSGPPDDPSLPPARRSRPSTPADHLNPPPPLDKLKLVEGGHMPGVYENYLLVRPYPSLRILFASPSLRIPGMLQSNLLDRVGGSGRTRDQVQQALAEGRGVTAKVRWISSPRRRNNNNAGQYSGRPRWIHATPLIGRNGSVGVWMVVIVDEEEDDVLKWPMKPHASVKQRRFGLSSPLPEVD
jgi:hypothetical protein